MRQKLFRTLTSTLLIAGLARSAFAQESGIGVSEPIVFSDYALRKMALLARAQFEALQSDFFTVNASGALQGGRSSSSGLGIEAQLKPQTNTIQQSQILDSNMSTLLSSLNAATSSATNNSAGTNASANPNPAVSGTSAAANNATAAHNATADTLTNTTYNSHAFTNVTVPGLNLSFVTLSNVGLDKAADSAFQISPLDLLTEKLSLFYRKVNFDYLLSASQSEITNRRQVVVGFDVAIDPHTRDEDCIAEVQVEMQPPGHLPDPQPDGEAQELYPPRAPAAAKVMQLIPRGDTYNVLTVKEDVSNVGFGFVFGPLSFGSRSVNEDKSFYLVQDTDTVAFVKDSRTFGWRFRPVLGRTFVQPGIRRVYALVSVDSQYSDGKVPVHVKTRWIHSNSEHTALDGDDFGVRRFASSFSVTRPFGSLAIASHPSAVFSKFAEPKATEVAFKLRDYHGEVVELSINAVPANRIEVVPSSADNPSARQSSPPAEPPPPETRARPLQSGIDTNDTWVRAIFNTTIDITPTSVVWIRTEHGAFSGTWDQLFSSSLKENQPETPEKPPTLVLFPGPVETTLLLSGPKVEDVVRVVVNGKTIKHATSDLPTMYKLNRRARPPVITAVFKDGKTKSYTRADAFSDGDHIEYRPVDSPGVSRVRSVVPRRAGTP